MQENRATILIVDDVEINRIILREILCADYDILEACDGVEAIDILHSTSKLPAVVLLDIMMPNMDGYDVIRLMKANPVTEEIPVLFITAADVDENETKVLQEGALDFIMKPFNHNVVKARVDNHVQLSNYRRNLEEMVDQKTRELSIMYKRILDTFATIMEYRSLESGMHIRRTVEFTKILVHRLLEKAEFHDQLVDLNYESMIEAVSLHDIGKIGVPDNVLLKPGKLTSEEFDIIKTHSTIGGDIINSISNDVKDDKMYLKHGKDIAMYHHERWDGKGYPARLKGEDIPLSARIVAVVDVYDALTSKRCYKDQFTHEKATEIIMAGRDTQFDPDIVDAFFEDGEKFEQVMKTLNDK